jgi:hypothetical protein
MIRTCRFRCASVAAFALFVGAAWPALSPAAVTIGSDLSTAPTTNFSCSPGCTLAQAGFAGVPVTSPTDGVIVRWRVRTAAGSDLQLIRLRVVHPGVGSASGAGTSDEHAIPTDARTQSYDTRLAIRANDRLGLDLGLGVSGGTDAFAYVIRSGGGGVDIWTPPLVDGAPPRAHDLPFLTTEDATFNADVEPDADGDRFGDETQDACPAMASKQGACIITGPSIGGTTEVGRTLAANGGSVQGGAASYQWLRGTGNTFKPVPGATAATYPLRAADRGKRLMVTESVSNPKGSDAATSSPTAVVGPPIVSSGAKKTQRVVKQRGVIVKVKSGLAGQLTATGTIALPKGAARTLRFKRVKRALAAGKSRKVRLTLSKKAFTTLRRALAGKRKLRAKLVLTVKDGLGGKGSKKLSIKLKR